MVAQKTLYPKVTYIFKLFVGKQVKQINLICEKSEFLVWNIEIQRKDQKKNTETHSEKQVSG